LANRWLTCRCRRTVASVARRAPRTAISLDGQAWLRSESQTATRGIVMSVGVRSSPTRQGWTASARSAHVTFTDIRRVAMHSWTDGVASAAGTDHAPHTSDLSSRRRADRRGPWDGSGAPSNPPLADDGRVGRPAGSLSRPPLERLDQDMTREEAVVFLKARGVAAQQRQWAMGATIQVFLGSARKPNRV
jgi:hypothetical protein